MTTTRSYDVVALSFPIVYTKDGDHDPNGMLFALQAYRPLLEFAKQQWDADDQLLPRLHRRRQLIQLVVDGIDRYLRMRDRITEGNPADHYLLAELGDHDERRDRGDRDSRGPRQDPRARAVRQNYRATVDEITLALDELDNSLAYRLPDGSALDMLQATRTPR